MVLKSMLRTQLLRPDTDLTTQLHIFALVVLHSLLFLSLSLPLRVPRAVVPDSLQRDLSLHALLLVAVACRLNQSSARSGRIPSCRRDRA